MSVETLLETSAPFGVRCNAVVKESTLAQPQVSLDPYKFQVASLHVGDYSITPIIVPECFVNHRGFIS
jgi:hypothetical protein